MYIILLIATNSRQTRKAPPSCALRILSSLSLDTIRALRFTASLYPPPAALRRFTRSRSACRKFDFSTHYNKRTSPKRNLFFYGWARRTKCFAFSGLSTQIFQISVPDYATLAYHTVHWTVWLDGSCLLEVRVLSIILQKQNSTDFCGTVLFLAGLEGLEPPKCRNQNPVPYQLGDSPISTQVLKRKKW